MGVQPTKKMGGRERGREEKKKDPKNKKKEKKREREIQCRKVGFIRL